MKRNTKAKGDISASAVMTALLKANAVLLLPFGDNQRYDLVIDDALFGFVRIQCKTAVIKSGAILFRTCNHPGGKGKGRDYRGGADLFGVYCPYNDKTYLVPVDEVGTSACSLRLDVPLNSQQSGIRLASDYEITHGTVAQLVERVAHNDDVTRSNRVSATSARMEQRIGSRVS